jgi:hypothetical protein
LLGTIACTAQITSDRPKRGEEHRQDSSHVDGEIISSSCVAGCSNDDVFCNEAAISGDVNEIEWKRLFDDCRRFNSYRWQKNFDRFVFKTS